MPWLGTMSLPRRIVPGASYLVTRRCSERRFFLRPSAQVNAIFEYLLAVVAERYGVRVHAYCVLSNHVHLVVTDPLGRLPDFQRDLAGLLARAVNASLGRWETFWAPHTFSAVALGSPEDVVSKAGYTLANPVAAGLVPAGRLWPGLWSSRDAAGHTERMWLRCTAVRGCTVLVTHPSASGTHDPSGRSLRSQASISALHIAVGSP